MKLITGFVGSGNLERETEMINIKHDTCLGVECLEKSEIEIKQW